ASILLQFLLLGAGGYLLVRRCGVGREGATLAASVLSLSGPAASLASMQNLLSAAAWVPIGLWAFLRGLEPGRRGLLAAAAALVAVILIAAEPASLLAFLLLALVLGATDGAPGRPIARRLLLPLGAVLGLATLIAAAQILPARDLLPLSSRGAGFTAEEGLKWSLQPVRILGMLLPRLTGDPTRLHPASWWGRWLFDGGYPFLLTVYLGAIPCLLALYALTSGGAGAPRRRTLGAVAALGLLLSLGRHAAVDRFLFRTLPGADQVRYPERFLLVALFAMALLAAFGLDRLVGGAGPPPLRHAALPIAAAALIFAATTLVVAAPSLADRFLTRGLSVPEGLLRGEAGPVLRASLLRSLLWGFSEAAALALGAALAGRAAAGRLRRLPAWGVVAVSGVSTVLAAAPALSTAAPGWVSTPSPLEASVGHGAGALRLHHHPRPEGLSVWGGTDELVWGFRFDRFTYSLGSGHRDRVPTILDPATDRMDLRGQADLGRALRRLPLGERLKVLRICHAGFLISYSALEHPDLEAGPVLEGFSRPAARLYRIRSDLPRVRFVPAAVPPSSPGDLAASLASKEFDPRSMVLLDRPRPVPPRTRPQETGDAGEPDSGPPPAGSPPASASIVEETPERVRIAVDAPSSGYLVLSDAHAPGWRALIDGEPAEVLRANGIFRAVALERGRHDVVMTYEPEGVRAGLWLSAAGLAVAAAWGAGSRWVRA
ncbi:MAG: YfhO family protein, partial [Planctomycetota bacterium]